VRRPLSVLTILVLLMVGLAALVEGCAPMLFGHSPGAGLAFVVVVENGDTAYAETASISWWSGSTVVGSSTVLMPPGGHATFVLGAVPDGLQLDALAWPGGNVFGGPDYAGATIFHVLYPSGATWQERFP
jgi:hypothetical protein